MVSAEDGADRAAAAGLCKPDVYARTCTSSFAKSASNYGKCGRVVTPGVVSGCHVYLGRSLCFNALGGAYCSPDAMTVYSARET